MRRLLLLAPLALALGLVAGGCGGKAKPLAATARPCLAKLGFYVHHAPIPTSFADTTPRLPVVDPDVPPRFGQAPVQLAWPDDFQEYGEVSFRPTKRGANDVQVLIFGDDKLPQRILVATRKAERLQLRAAFRPTPSTRPRWVRVGQTLVLWSSTPPPGQRSRVLACLDS
jgi:hypothetical protein